MLEIQENFNPTCPNTTTSFIDGNNVSASTTNADFNAATAVTCNINSQMLKNHSTGTIIADLKYILYNIDLLERSRNCTSVVELLDDLMTASYYLKPIDFPPDSTNFVQLIRTIAKLKLLVPRKQEDALGKNEVNEQRNKKKVKLTVRNTDKEKDVTDSDGDIDKNSPEMQHLSHSYDSMADIQRKDATDSDGDIDMNSPEMQHLSHSYASMSDIQRKCLLYFAVFPHCFFNFGIKERTLIQLWYGEGFIDPQHEESEIGAARNDPKRASTTKGAETANTIEEIGREILMVLREKRFIKKAEIWEEWIPQHLIMESYVQSFVRERAKAEGLFGFDDKKGKLTPHFCLLNLSSFKLWPNYTNSPENLESFNSVRTLLNVNEPVVDIRAEWLSKMRSLHVLHAGVTKHETNEERRESEDRRYKEKHIEVVDMKFLEELKNMKQLRLLSLEGFAAIAKLSESVCKLTNLKILNLRECSYLEELPAGIGSLKNLTHLDLTDCRVLSKLPKEIRFLSKLEVLKGFFIYYQIGGRQHRNTCTLVELMQLQKLRKLNLVVNADKFPSNEDLRVFKEMTNLCNLKIAWEKNYDNDQSSHDAVGHSRWKQLKCWEQQTRQHETTEEPSTSNSFNNLKKLAMHCFPLGTAPNWLHPSVLQKLERLYIVGGELTTLARDINQNAWNVKTLRLRHLQKLDMDWEELRHIFSNMTYCHSVYCGIRNFYFGNEWTLEIEKSSEEGEVEFTVDDEEYYYDMIDAMEAKRTKMAETCEEEEETHEEEDY